MRIVFFGTPEFARTILEYLVSQNSEVIAVVTRPDKPKGRSNKPMPSPVKEWALANHLPIYQPLRASDPDFADFLKGLHADFFIVAAYAEILKENILAIPRLACINVHGSILPKYRGAAPVQRAIMAGEKQTGVTIMKMAPQMDAGDILAVSTTPIPIDMNAGELMQKLADLGKDALWQVLQQYEQGTIFPIKQDVAQVSFAKKLSPQEAEVQWNLPCEVIHNKIRGMNPNPGAWCWVEVKGERKRLQIKKTLPNYSMHGHPGDILSTHPTELIIGCENGAVSLLEVQLEGKKSMSIDVFLRGIAIKNLKFCAD